MSEQVTAFWPVQSERFEYLFFVTNWNDYSSTISKSLEDNLETFAADIGLRGKVIEAYSHAKSSTFQEVMAKDGWPPEVRERFDIENFPFMLIISTNFQEFNPHQHTWSIIWFSDFLDDPNSIPVIFCNLYKKIMQDTSLFDYLVGLAQDNKSSAFSDYFEFKPGIFGASVDVKVILCDIGKAIKGKLKK